MSLERKLKQLTNEAKDHHSSFTDLTKLYKEDKINEKDFFSKVLNYVITSSALTFLIARVILELKSALEKGTTIKDVTGGATSASSAPQMGGFGKSKLRPRFGRSMCHFPRRLCHPRLVKSVERYFQSRQDSAVSVAKLRKILSNPTY
jgi:hypothetical protein